MISVRNISKSFGSQSVLKNVSIEIADGTTTAIVGPSGVGKSVLLKLILGILQPDSGEVLIGDKKISSIMTEEEKNEIRKDLGVLFQSAALLDSLSIYDNIAFPLVQRNELTKEEIHQKILDISKELSLDRFLFNSPQEVSLGIRKRAGFARALITHPKVFLLDEPNTGLDPLVGQEVYDLIKKCKKLWGFAGIVISHELPEVFQVADRVVMLLHGGVIADGTPEDLINSNDPAVQQFLKGNIDGPIKIQ